MAAEIAANIKKKGFILYKKDLNLCCAHFDDTAIGRIMRHINEYVKNPSYTPQKIEFAEQLQYDLFVDGIRENTEEWRDKIVQRRLRYEESKKNNSDNSDNPDKKNNSDNCDNPDKTKKTVIDKNKTSEDNTAQSNQVQSNQVQSNQVQSNQTTSNDVSSTQFNSNSKKEFNVNNKIFFNQEYVRKYLVEKKIYFTQKGFQDFFNYNCEIFWPYKPETAARRWFKNNPDDQWKPGENEIKKDPPQPGTPSDYINLKRTIESRLYKVDSITASTRQILKTVHIKEVTDSIDGKCVVFSAPSESAARLMINYQLLFIEVFEKYTKSKVLKAEFCFPANGELHTIQSYNQRFKKLIGDKTTDTAEPKTTFKDTPQKLTTETTTPPALKNLHAEILDQCKNKVTSTAYKLYYETIDLLAVDYYNTDHIDGTRYAELTIGVISQNFIDKFKENCEEKYATAFKIIKAYEPHIFYKIINPEI